MVNGVLYVTLPDHVWAVDARTGREIWHFAWPSTGGIHIGNRGVAIAGDWLYFETPDCHLVSLNVKDGTERWRQKICDLDLFYYGSVAPVIVKNMVIAGVSGDDLDFPGYVQAHDLATGEMQWKWYVVPQKMGEPGSETWPNEDAMKHGGGMTWQPVTYDPELNHIYVSTGNPQPVIAHKNRKGDNLYTGAFVALNADTGKMAWYFQSSPHDTHDWDSTQTPVVFDGVIDGKPRKLIAQAARNGHFFVLDRTTGKAIISSEYVKTNWTSGYDAKGQPIPNPAKEPQIDGALVTPNQGGATNWPPPSFSPATGPLLRQRLARVQHLLPLRHRRQPDGLGRHRSRRLLRVDDPGDRLQDRQDPLVAHQWESNIRERAAQHGRQPAVRRRTFRRTSSP